MQVYPFEYMCADVSSSVCVFEGVCLCLYGVYTCMCMHGSASECVCSVTVCVYVHVHVSGFSHGDCDFVRVYV